MNKQKILFVCTGNTCRSPMAEYLLKELLSHSQEEERFEVRSAGIQAVNGKSPSEKTVHVMRENGIDISGHRSCLLKADMMQNADKVFVMEQDDKEILSDYFPTFKHKLYLITDFSPNSQFNEIVDPIQGEIEEYRNIFTIIDGCVKDIIKNLM